MLMTSFRSYNKFRDIYLWCVIYILIYYIILQVYKYDSSKNWNSSQRNVTNEGKVC